MTGTVTAGCVTFTLYCSFQVFMPQQYNSPIGMYSAGNVIDTFQTQAEVRMQDMEK